MIGIFVAFLSGILMSVQGVFNTQVSKATSIWVANVWVQCTAFLMCLIVWGLVDRNGFMTLTKVEPKYLLGGGVIGTFITLTVIQSMSSLGPAKAIMAIVIAQITSSYLIELTGLFGVDQVPFSIGKTIGLMIAIIGVILFETIS